MTKANKNKHETKYADTFVQFSFIRIIISVTLKQFESNSMVVLQYSN